MDPKERRKIVTDFWFKDKVVNTENLYRPRDGDIIAVGPVKSGTTWMQQILHQIRTKGDETFKDIYEVTWHILNPKRQWDFNLNADQKFNPRVFKHHEPYGTIENNEKQKIVFIVRDPYDAVFSMTKFSSGFYGDHEDLTEDETGDLLIAMHEKNTCASFLCISTWWEHRNDPNVLFLFYEDLIHDLETMIRKISDFVEIPLTEVELRRVCYLSSFEYMAKHKEKFQGDSIISTVAQSMGIESWTPTIGRVRTGGGEIGQGVDNLTPMLKDIIDDLWQETVQEQHGLKSYQDMYNEHGIFSKEMKSV